MSIIIKGIEMPKKCEQCWFFGTDSARVCYCYLLKGELPLSDGVPQDCPLIELPPHGRLIDADKLGIRDAEKQAYEAYLREKGEYFIEEPIIEYHRGYLEGLTHASGLVRFAPTIIPASKEET